MKNKIFHLGSTFKALSENEDGSVEIRGFASTAHKDRVGDIIETEAWTKGGLENFQSNPIILFNHDYDRPIGRATSIEATKDGLVMNAKISKTAGPIRDMVKEGILGAFSVGFRVKDAEYMVESDGYKIKDAELFEVSVVSVPANQAATFSLAKSFESDSEYREFLKQFKRVEPAELPADTSVNAQESAGDTAKVAEQATFQEKTMENEKGIDFDAITKAAAAEAAKAVSEQMAADRKAAEEAAARKAAEDEEFEKRVRVSVESNAEKLVSDIEKRFKEENESLEKIVGELREELTEKSAEIEKMRESKRVFADRGGNGDWKKEFAGDVVDNYFLGLATGKGWNTERGTELMQKVNEHSGVQVSSADFEQVVSTNIERDIQNELVLAPLFREIQMTSASMILPILPDAGYAEFTTNQTASGDAPHGNLAQRGDSYGSPYGGVDLAEKTLTVKKLISTSFLGNETEEDAILPILPLIRESMVRSHARAIENALLVGNMADGAFGTGGASFDGLVSLAVADSHTVTDTGGGSGGTFDAADALTAADLLDLRKRMGKYGVRPEEVVYLVSQEGYYNLLEDAEFQDANLVGDMATKLTGEIGQVFGSRVLLVDEFAAKAAGKFFACAVNPRNYVIPRLRGVTVETDYEVRQQRRVLVASQRLGFTDIIDAAASKYALKYAAA
jgi:HK97 family phage prohead protease